LGICSILDLSHDGIYQRHTDLCGHLEVIDTALTRNPEQLGDQIEFSVLTDLHRFRTQDGMAESWNVQILSICTSKLTSCIFINEQYWTCLESGVLRSIEIAEEPEMFK
jgi:hypothetical protein